MKHLRRLLPALCLLLISAMCAGTSTYAWFSLNNQVTASGMQVKAKTSGSLVIDTAALTTSSNKTSVTFNYGEVFLKPATYSYSGATGGTLKCLSTAAEKKVDATTGLIGGQAASGSDLTAAIADTNYKDYDVWVGAQGEAVSSVTLTVKTDAVSGVQTAISALVSLDNGSTWNNYQLTAAGVNCGTIPSVGLISSEFSGVHVTVRVYFDGAMMDGNKTYVRTQGMSLADVNITLDFQGSNNT